MTRRETPQIPPIGPDVDLDVEEYYLPNGERLTEARAAELAEEAIQEHYRARGRPSLTAPTAHTPRVTLRLPGPARAALEQIAVRDGRRFADVARDAIDEYIARHAS